MPCHLGNELSVRGAVFRPAARVLRLGSVLCCCDQKSFLCPRNTHEIDAALLGELAPESLGFDPENDDRVKLKPLAFVDCEKAYGLIV